MSPAKSLLTYALITIASSFIALILYGQILTAHQYLLILCVGCIQFFGAFWPTILDRLAPIQLIEYPDRRKLQRSYVRGIALVLPCAIAFNLLWLGFGFAIFLASLYSIEFISHRKKRLASSAFYKNYRPQVLVYIAGSDEISYQVNQWLAVLEKIDSKVSIISRNCIATETISPTKIPIFYCRRLDDLEFFCENGPETILYPGNPVKNVHALRQIGLEHIFINHGESDKVVNQSKILMAYDKILVAGALAEQRLRDAKLPLRVGQVIQVGRPQAELYLDKILEPLSEIKTILYAPTWEGFLAEADYSSVSEFGYNILSQLAEKRGIEIKFKPHPFTGKSKKQSRFWLKKMLQLCVDKDVHVLNQGDSLYEAMNWSDLLISDVSSVLNDYLVTSKPIVLCNSQSLEGDDLRVLSPSSAGSYILEKQANVGSLIDNISRSDSSWGLRLETRVTSLGDPNLNSFSLFESAVCAKQRAD